MASGLASSQSLVGSLALGYFGQLCPTLVFYGLYLFLFPYSVVIILRKPSSSSRYYLLGATTLLFISITINASTQITLVIEQLNDSSNSGSSTPQGPSSVAGDLAFASQNVIFIVADAIVIWRAYALFANNTTFRLILILSGLLNTVLLITISILTASSIHLTKTLINFYASRTFISLATNILATAAIGFKTRRYRREMADLGMQKTTIGGRTLSLITETGLGFCVMQLLNSLLVVVHYSSGPATYQAWRAIIGLTICAAAIFPTLLIVIVERENTSIIGESPVIRTINHSDQRATRSSQFVMRFGSHRTTEVEEELGADVKFESLGRSNFDTTSSRV